MHPKKPGQAIEDGQQPLDSIARINNLAMIKLAIPCGLATGFLITK